MTKFIYQEFVKHAPDCFHTVAPVTYQSAEDGQMPLIALEDIEDGTARALGAEHDLNFAKAKLPALLIHEYALGQCILVAVWHRDDTATEMNSGARISIRTRDELLSAALSALGAVDKAIDLAEIGRNQVRFSYENAYQAALVSIPFKYDTTCIQHNGTSFGGTLVTLPDFIPGIY